MSGSNEPQAVTAGSGQGVFLTGELLSVADAKSYQDRDGNTRTPCRVKLLVNDSVLSVEFQDELAATEQLKGATKGEPVTLPVFVQGPWDPETRRRQPVFFRGR